MPTSVSNSRRHSQFTIARDLKLSQASVSNALNGKRHLCNPETYARIWAHATTVGYHGRGMALEIAPPAGGRRQVGVIFGGDPLVTRCDPGIVAVLCAVERNLAKRGVSVVSFGSPGEPWQRLDDLARGGLRKPALLILGEVDPAFVAGLMEHPRRIVTIGSAFPRHAPAIVNHDEQAADLLLSHLKNLGHSRVGWLGGGAAMQSLATKQAALRKAAAKHGLKMLPEGMTFALASREAGRGGAREILRFGGAANVAPTALVCSDAAVARGALEQFAVAGVIVPGDLSVVALEASRARNDESPAITAAGSDPEAMGAMAAEMLVDFAPITAAYTAPVHPPARFFAGETTGPVVAANSVALHLLRNALERNQRRRTTPPAIRETHAA